MSAVFDTYREFFSRSEALRTDYPWDAWRSTFYFYFMDVDLAPRLAAVSDPALAGLALAASEWVCARLWPHPGVEDVLEFIDAAWVQVLEAGRCQRVEFASDDWPGPVRGPLRYAQLIVADTIFDARQDKDFVARSCWACNLARHVIDGPQLAEFQGWITSIGERLDRFHPYDIPKPASTFDDQFPTPPPVPPAAFCHEARYDPSQIDKYMADHMSDLSSNRYFLPA